MAGCFLSFIFPIPLSLYQEMIYSPIIGLTQKLLSNLPGVKGIYLRGSLSRGDGVLGKSDIDLTILIEKFEDEEEARLLYQLYRIYRSLKKIFPVMGEWEIFDEEEFYSFHLKNTHRGYLAKYWKELRGSKQIFKIQRVKEQDVLKRIAWWIFEVLPPAYWKGNLHTLLNAYLETYALFEYLKGESANPFPSRNKLLGNLVKRGKERELRELYFLRKRSFLFLDRGNSKRLANWLYGKILQRVFKNTEILPSMKISAKEIPPIIKSFKPFHFLPRKYRLISCEDNFSQMGEDIILAPLPLFLPYLRFLSPWEIESLKKYNPGIITISSSPFLKEYLKTLAVIKELRYHIFKFPPVSLFFYFQLRLYLEKDFVAPDLTGLIQEYRRNFSDFDFLSSLRGKEIILKGYPLMKKRFKDLLRNLQNS